MFPAEIYAARRSVLRQRLGGGVTLFLGNGESPMNYADNCYPFRQDSTFLYYWGLDEPGLAALFDLDAGRAVLYGHQPTLEEVVWTGPLPSLGERAERVGVAEHRPIEGLAEDLAALGRRPLVLPPYRADTRLWLAELLGIAPAAVDEAVSEPFARAVIAQRSIKAPEEVEEIERAVEVSHAMHTLAMRRAAPGRYEWEVAREVEAMVVGRGARLAFPSICSVRGEVLHNHTYDNRMEAGQVVVHDAGAASPIGYASDITRSFPVSGRFTTEQREVYEIVLGAHLKAIEALRPGVPFRQIYDLVALALLEGLAGLGLVRGDLEEAVARGAHALFFQCGCGHMVGLDVHDMEALGEDLVGYDESVRRSELFGVSSLRLGRALEPGFVVAVEPGLYFIPELIERWEAERRFAEIVVYDALHRFCRFGGMRIEDDFLVTEEGPCLLGPPIPRTVEEIEAGGSS